MKIEELVLTVEQMNHLKELGLEFYETSLCWYLNFFSKKYDHVGINKRTKSDYLQEKRDNLSSPIPTLTLQEILNLLPEEINDGTMGKSIEINKIVYKSAYGSGGNDFTFKGKNLLEAAYEALSWLTEYKYLNKKYKNESMCNQ